MTCTFLAKFGSSDWCNWMNETCEGCGCRTDGVNEDGVECVAFKPDEEEEEEEDGII